LFGVTPATVRSAVNQQSPIRCNFAGSELSSDGSVGSRQMSRRNWRHADDAYCALALSPRESRSGCRNYPTFVQTGDRAGSDFPGLQGDTDKFHPCLAGWAKAAAAAAGGALDPWWGSTRQRRVAGCQDSSADD